jgi:hypothetical protein
MLGEGGTVEFNPSPGHHTRPDHYLWFLGNQHLGRWKNWLSEFIDGASIQKIS